MTAANTPLLSQSTNFVPGKKKTSTRTRVTDTNRTASTLIRNPLLYRSNLCLHIISPPHPAVPVGPIVLFPYEFSYATRGHCSVHCWSRCPIRSRGVVRRTHVIMCVPVAVVTAPLRHGVRTYYTCVLFTYYRLWRMEWGVCKCMAIVKALPFNSWKTKRCR